MNEIPIRQAFELLGKNGREQVKQFVTHLKVPMPNEARIMASVITRSEAELFGISVPRFAIRFYFQKNQGFINCRRLADFIKRSGLDNEFAWGKKPSQTSLLQKPFPEPVNYLPPIRIRRVLQQRNQSCIADCLLAPPDRFGANHSSTFSCERFHVLKTRLNNAYGESLPGDSTSNFEGSPYVKNITLGGGLCAQSVCYMATALLNEEANGIYGLAEITALAHDPDYAVFSISGLDLDNIGKYFSSAGLRSIQQMPAPRLKEQYENKSSSLLNSEGRVAPYLRLEFLQEFQVALNAYLLSNMPVIFPTDLGLLNGHNVPLLTSDESVFKKNGWKLGSDFKQDITNRHTVIIIGCSLLPAEKEFGAGDQVFVFHDPGAGPFLTATARELSCIGSYKNGMAEHDDGVFMPVTPQAVKIPLLSWRAFESQERPVYGLIHKAKLFRRISSNSYPQIGGTGYGCFYLTQLRNIQSPHGWRGVTHSLRLKFPPFLSS